MGALGAFRRHLRALGFIPAIHLGIAGVCAVTGTISFEGRYDYGTIGVVTHPAARPCGEAGPGQILVSQKVYGRVESRVRVEPMGELPLKGLLEPMRAYNVIAMED